MSIGRSPSIADELLAVQRHFVAEGRDPTDVELETIAQTWSEHCSHKTFRATLVTDDGDERPPLLTVLRRCTDAIDAPFVRSAFVGNAGIISYRPGTTIALKAETHNHPSAVEPFGGANTGVGGVIRDVLGAAHRPIAITDVLCFGPPDTPLADVPDGALHPLRIREGVIDGVADYGNKIGLPTVAGAVLYDPAYTTNPLVFAGCIGVADDRPAFTGPHPGDRVIVIGGRTGRDGIRGATFSSLTMDATTGSVAGASVQIGDPVTEKLLIDVLVGAEDLYTAITDCGAGGLSSAVGEMADGVGADVELDLVPLKYAGLDPWEIWLSEAQERMVVAVDPHRLGELARALPGPRRRARRSRRVHRRRPARRAITRRRRARSRHRFLHDGRPPRRMTAAMPEPDRTAGIGRTVDDPRAVLLALLAHRNIASKATTIHRYDHEILGARRCARSSVSGPMRLPTGSCWPVPATTTGWRSASVSTRGTGSTTPRRWRTPWSTRRSATSSPSAPTPTASRCSTTSRGATRGGHRRSATWSPPSTGAVRQPSPIARRSSRGRTRSTTSTPAPTASVTRCHRRW